MLLNSKLKEDQRRMSGQTRSDVYNTEESSLASEDQYEDDDLGGQFHQETHKFKPPLAAPRSFREDVITNPDGSVRRDLAGQQVTTEAIIEAMSTVRLEPQSTQSHQTSVKERTLRHTNPTKKVTATQVNYHLYYGSEHESTHEEPTRRATYRPISPSTRDRMSADVLNMVPQAPVREDPESGEDEVAKPPHEFPNRGGDGGTPDDGNDGDDGDNSDPPSVDPNKYADWDPEYQKALKCLRIHQDVRFVTVPGSSIV